MALAAAGVSQARPPDFSPCVQRLSMLLSFCLLLSLSLPPPTPTPFSPLFPLPSPCSFLLCLLLSLSLSSPLPTPLPLLLPLRPLPAQLSTPFSAILLVQPLLTAPPPRLSVLPVASLPSGLSVRSPCVSVSLLPSLLPPPSLLILPACSLPQLFHFLSLPRLPSPCLRLRRPPPLHARPPWRSPSVPLPSASIFRLWLPSLCPLMGSITEPPATSSRRGPSPAPFPSISQPPRGGDH